MDEKFRRKEMSLSFVLLINQPVYSTIHQNKLVVNSKGEMKVIIISNYTELFTLAGKH